MALSAQIKGSGATVHTSRSADYESSKLAYVHRSIYLRERASDHRCQLRPGRVFSMIML
jgi:hypothetical protein